jgi:hypothetical protein
MLLIMLFQYLVSYVKGCGLLGYQVNSHHFGRLSVIILVRLIKNNHSGSVSLKITKNPKFEKILFDIDKVSS